jgi:hypothetical protein
LRCGMGFEQLIAALPSVAPTRELVAGQTLFRQGDAATAIFAAELGLTHETLYRTLAGLEHEGVLERVDGGLRLLKTI